MEALLIKKLNLLEFAFQEQCSKLKIPNLFLLNHVSFHFTLILSNHKLLISIRKPFIINVPLNEKKAQLCIFIYMFLPSGRRFSQFFITPSILSSVSFLVVLFFRTAAVK
jgi:hypothetical protein